jgi:hypothetical protein
LEGTSPEWSLLGGYDAWYAWQRLLRPFSQVFTRPGYRRFVEWVTALALNVEEHSVTQSAVAIERIGDWRALERFAEYGAWDPPPSPAA